MRWRDAYRGVCLCRGAPAGSERGRVAAGHVTLWPMARQVHSTARADSTAAAADGSPGPQHGACRFYRRRTRREYGECGDSPAFGRGKALASKAS